MKELLAATFLSTTLACASAPRAPTAEVEPREHETAAAVALRSLAQANAALHEWRTQAGAVSEDERAGYRQLLDANAELRRELAALDARLAPAPAKRAALPANGMRSYEMAKPWIDSIRALGPDAPARREAALVDVRAALASSEPATQHAALIALQSVGDIDYDKASFRPLVLPLTESATGPALVSAFYALWNTVHEDADLARLQAAWTRDPQGLRSSMLHLSMMFGGGRFEGRSEDIALEVLAGPYSRSESGLNGLWGARVGPKLEARVLELANDRDREVVHDALYFGLSTFEDKSGAVVDRLIAALADSDPNNWHRALWGLGHGVPVELQPKVASALVEMHNSRSDASVREECARIVGQYGDAATRERLLK